MSTQIKMVKIGLVFVKKLVNKCLLTAFLASTKQILPHFSFAYHSYQGFMDRLKCAYSLSGNPNMQNSKTIFSTVLSTLIIASTLTPATSQAENSNNGPMSLAILGALGSLGLACYQGTAPCVLRPHINTDKLTFSADAGTDNKLNHARIAIGADWDEKVFEAKNWEVTGRWDFSLHGWNSDEKNIANDSGYIIGLTPVFHYQLKNFAYTPFIEMGGGPHILSDINIENEYKSTQFQFGSIFGLGVKRDALEISYRYLHISNAGIEMPNPGTDIHNIHIGYHF